MIKIIGIAGGIYLISKLFKMEYPEKISNHISFTEATHSPTAKKRGIRNLPNAEQLNNMKDVAKYIFEPVRAKFGNKPIKVESFFRALRLNRLIGSKDTSQHPKGQAIDIDDDFGGATNKQMFEYIRDHLEFDQLIWEFGNDNNPEWVHVSYVKGRNRKQVFRAYKIKGMTVYKRIN